MPRQTLKLPAKPAAAAASGSPSRKPVRGGVKGNKTLSAPPGERSVTRPAPAKAAAPRRADPPAAPGPGRGETARPAPAASRTAPPKKVHPPRGIARSSGARALPPRREAPPAGAAPLAAAPTADVAPTPTPAPVPAPETRVATETRPQRTANEPPRLAKRVAEMAQCSRRVADEWIENGWVSVDGVVVTTLGTRVHAAAKLEIADAAQTHRSEAVTILYHRPPTDADGLLTPAPIRADNRWSDDDRARHFKATHLRGLAPVAKLDPEASGLVVYTQEGSIARRLTGDQTRLEKEYLVRVDGQIDADGLARLVYGLELDGVKLRRAQVSWQSEQQLRVVLQENRRQQIQRMCELVGLRVVAIKRLRIGSVPLGRLPAGQWRYLRADERF